MHKIVGIDGCKGGWVIVFADSVSGRIECRLSQSLAMLRPNSVNPLPFTMAAIDMPIGLPESGYRRCDVEARRRLGRYGARVFTGLRRPLIHHKEYSSANAWAKSDGAGLSRQAWNLVAKIRQIDSLVTPANQQTIIESHPELVFQRLNGGAPLVSKKTAEGVTARVRLLTETGLDPGPLLCAPPGPGVAADDILDALAVLLTAARAARGEASRLPVAAKAEADARGLDMAIWY